MKSFIANRAVRGAEIGSRVASNGSAPDWEVLGEGVRIIAVRALGDSVKAEDVAQESIARALASFASGRAEAIEDPAAFVYGIARHIITDVHRASGRIVSIDFVDEPPAPHIDALDGVIAEEDAVRVRAAVTELPTADRDLLRLYFVDGLRAEEIATRLREPIVNVRKRKSRALERLRRIFLGCHAEPSSPTGKV